MLLQFRSIRHGKTLERLKVRTALLITALVVINPASAVDVSEFASFHTPASKGMPYRAIQTPGRSNGELLPLIIFLHGSGQNGDDNEVQIDGNANGALELVDTAIKANLSLVFVAPQVDGDYWAPRDVVAVVADAMRHYPLDPRRVLLTGVSDGGTGVWDTLKAYPTCFAAGAPMSGMTELAGLASIRDVPLWVFHGSKDNDTDIETGYGGAMLGSRPVVRALRALGSNPLYTEYAGQKHVIWPRAFGEEKLLPWLMHQRLPGSECEFSSTAVPDPRDGHGERRGSRSR
ncbi:MAG: hypothetical protein ABIR16_06130 [Dokdonella sp.]